MKRLFFTDVHLGLNKENPIFFDVLTKLFKEIDVTCKNERISEVYFLGDFFDNPRTISQKAYDMAMKLMDILKGTHVYIIRGNHDTFHKELPQPNWTQLFKNFNYITVVEDSPLIMGDIGMVPWGVDFSEVEVDYLLGHFEINSFLLNDFIECRNAKLNISDFNRFKKVYSGHFHNRMEKNNITYIGAPFQQNFGDVNAVRGYCLFENGNLEFIEFTSAPKFVKIKSDEQIDKSQIKGNIIKLIYTEDYGTVKNNLLLEKIEEMEPISLSIDMSNIKIDDKEIKREDIGEIKDCKNLLIDYINVLETPTHINKNMLKAITDKMIKEI